jgi:hypothetical protein
MKKCVGNGGDFVSKQLNRAEVYEDEGAQRDVRASKARNAGISALEVQTSRSWWEDEYETEESAAFREERDFNASIRILNAMPRISPAPSEPRLRIYDVISERGVVNLITSDGERGAILRAMREWNVSRGWIEKNATVRYLYSYDPKRKRRKL